MPALTGDWFDFTLRNGLVSDILEGWMIDMSPVNGTALAFLVLSTSMGSSSTANVEFILFLSWLSLMSHLLSMLLTNVTVSLRLLEATFSGLSSGIES